MKLLGKIIFIRMGKFAKDFEQNGVLSKKYANDVATVYSLKIPFRRFLLISLF